MNDVILFLNETSHVDKIYILVIFVILIATIALLLTWLHKKGIGLKIGGVQLSPAKVKELDDEEEKDKRFKDVKIDKETENQSNKMNNNLLNIIKKSEESHPELKTTIKTKVEELETKIDKLSKNIEQKEAEIQKLEKTIVKYTLDKTVDYISFQSCLEEIMNEYEEIMKGVCYTFSNDLEFCHIDEEEYNKLITDNSKKFLSQSREILKSKFSGKILKEISNLYVILPPEDQKKSRNNYIALYNTLRTLAAEREAIKTRVLEKTGQQISSSLINWKKSLVPRFEDLEKSDNSLSVSKKLNYLLQKDDILALVSTISSIYNNFKEQDKSNIFKKQMEVVDIFKTDFSLLLDINFKKLLIDTVNKEKIDITKCYHNGGVE